MRVSLSVNERLVIPLFQTRWSTKDIQKTYKRHTYYNNKNSIGSGAIVGGTDENIPASGSGMLLP